MQVQAKKASGSCRGIQRMLLIASGDKSSVQLNLQFNFYLWYVRSKEKSDTVLTIDPVGHRLIHSFAILCRFSVSFPPSSLSQADLFRRNDLIGFISKLTTCFSPSPSECRGGTERNA